MLWSYRLLTEAGSPAGQSTFYVQRKDDSGVTRTVLKSLWAAGKFWTMLLKFCPGSLHTRRIRTVGHVQHDSRHDISGKHLLLLYEHKLRKIDAIKAGNFSASHGRASKIEFDNETTITTCLRAHNIASAHRTVCVHLRTHSNKVRIGPAESKKELVVV